MNIQIKNRWTGAVIHEGDYLSIYESLKAALAAGRNNLSGANLSDANLCGANLCGANLSDANLRGADLRGANLRDADLRNANLRDADLRGANLRNANLRDANLRDADLRNANLRDADLRGANLSHVRADFLAEVLKLPDELDFLRTTIIEGKINGSSYEGECACLAGTLAHAKGIENYHGGAITNGMTFIADSSSPREVFFLAIKEGDTPENNGASALALKWTDEAIAIRNNILAHAPKP